MTFHPAQTPRVYHRLESNTQTPADARRQAGSGELWGAPPWNSDIPTVKAYTGSLPPGARGVEFECHVPPDRQTSPHLARWTGPRDGVIVEGGHARVAIRVVRNTQLP